MWQARNDPAFMFALALEGAQSERLAAPRIIFPVLSAVLWQPVSDAGAKHS